MARRRSASPPRAPLVGVNGSDHFRMLRGLGEPHDIIKERVMNNCLYRYAQTVKVLERLESNLTTHLLNTCSDEDACLYIRNKKLYFSLEYIFYITGLPITGKPVLESELNPHEICLQLLGVDGDGKLNIDPRALRDHLNVQDIDDDVALDRRARVYLLHIIGYIIFPASRNSFMVPVMFVCLLANLADIDSYAWGAGLLANIHFTLAKRKKNMASSVLPLYIFALIRLPGLATYYHVVRDKIPTSFPLVHDWAEII